MKSVFVNEIDDLLKSIDIHRIVFWTGAGIDADAPTSLPIGNQLTEYVLRLSCGEEAANKISEYWKNLSQKIQMRFNGEINFPSTPRLETVFEAINDFESHLFNHVSIIDGIKCFNDAPPNRVHYILAYLLHLGANIVTTNYDSTIKQAYEHLFGKQGFYLELEDNDRVFFYKSNHKPAGKIYYIHGMAQRIESIGATLSSVKNSFSDYFVSVLEDWFNKEPCFVFLGYGGVDAFDVNPFFKNHPPIRKSVAVYIRHRSNMDTDNRYDSRPNEDVLLSPFEKKFLVCHKTVDFLESIFHTDTQHMESNRFSWKEEFRNYYHEYSSDYQILCQLVICDFLGICINAIQGDNWYQKYLYNDRFLSIIDDYSFIGLYGLKNAERIGNKEAIEAFSHFYPNNNLGKSDVRAARNSKVNGFLEWIRVKKRLEQHLNAQISNKNRIGWNITTPLNRSVEVVFYAWSFRLFDNTVFRKMLLCSFRRTMRMMERTINAGYMYTNQINQINSNLIRLAFFNSFFYGNYPLFDQYIGEGLKGYAEVSSIDGVIDALVFRILGNLANNDCKSKNRVRKDIERDWKILIELLNDYKSTKYYHRLQFIQLISNRYLIALS